jgi:hypothetical protein
MKVRSIPQLGKPKSVSSLPPSDQELGKEDELVMEAEYYEASPEIAKKNALTGWRLLTTCLLGANVVFCILILLFLMVVVGRSAPTYITKGNGETEKLEFFTGNARSPSLIKFYAEKTITNIYTWRNTLPEKGNPADPGVMVEGGKKIPTMAFVYTLALEPKFANSFRKQLSELMAINQRGEAQVQAAYLVEHVGEPESIGSGQWKIKVIGNQLIQAAGQNPTTMPINVELTVRAVPAPVLSDISKKYSDAGLAKYAAAARAEGLEVLAISNIK